MPDMHSCNSNLERVLRCLRRIDLLLLAIALTGCAAQPTILERSAYWPFERIRFQSRAVGPLTVYTQSPALAVRSIVFVQAPPCGDASQSQQPLLSTAGILWDELKSDSRLVQLELPGRPRENAQTQTDCWPQLRQTIGTHRWSRALHEAVTVVQGESPLPTVYIGIGEGARSAVELASKDRRTAGLLIVNGTGLNPDFETLLKQLHHIDTPTADLLVGIPVLSPKDLTHDTTPRARTQLSKPTLSVPTLFVQSTADQKGSLESSALLWSQWIAAGANASMLVADGLGTDFGLDSGQLECFENMMRLIAQRVRAMGPPTSLAHVHCGSTEQAPPQEKDTAPVRLPDTDSNEDGTPESGSEPAPPGLRSSD